MIHQSVLLTTFTDKKYIEEEKSIEKIQQPFMIKNSLCPENKKEPPQPDKRTPRKNL